MTSDPNVSGAASNPDSPHRVAWEGAEAAPETFDRSFILADLADRLRRQHLAAHDVAHPLAWNELQPSEQARWLAQVSDGDAS